MQTNFSIRFVCLRHITTPVFADNKIKKGIFAMMEQQKPSVDEVPLGFGMALAQNEVAMRHFADMDERARQRVLFDARHVRSKAEMKVLIERIGQIQ